jgi:phosphoglycerol transferase MdoB-like AlkP superfamily enzyme
MLKTIFGKLKSWWGIAQTLAGSFIISSGWSWYHFKHKPYNSFFIKVFAIWIAGFISYQIFKWLYHFFTAKFNRHIFWQKEFRSFLDSLFFYFSLFFLVFFSPNQVLSLVLFLMLMGLFFWRTQKYISFHPDAHQWKLVNKNIFILIFFLFIFFSVFQYLAFRLANFDNYLKFHNIVLFRSWAMTMFLIFGFSVATLIYLKMRSFWRYLALGVWVLLFVLVLSLWVANISIMYFTGLYLSPLMLEVAKGSSGVTLNNFSLLIGSVGLLVLIIFIFIFRQIIKSYQKSSYRQWSYYSLALIAVALMSLFGLSSFQNTPEYTIARNFYEFFRGDNTEVVLSSAIKKKLEKFGLFYNLGRFDLAHRDKVFISNKKLLPEDLARQKPNVIILFFESFSSRLTSVYNKDLPGLTPNFEQMASDPHTTVFKNYFNASTPTINGIIAQLCSFLPPTGYSEIEVNKNLQRLRLLCLPNILKENGYHNTYITAVPKEFENKASIFGSMDVENIYGQTELSKMIKGEPLSWGYSDHQLFDVLWRMLDQKLTSKKEVEPFLMMLSTVDTHAPFDLAKDMIRYGDGKNNVLNSYHTADDAFGKFWEEFKKSEYYDNTIVVAVADHAAFPGSEIKSLAGQDANKLSFYDENMLMMYLPDLNPDLFGVDPSKPQNSLPKEVDLYSSSIDIAPTLLQILNINPENNFEGHSIFDDRQKYQNILGMHEYGLYINQEVNGQRKIDYQIPSQLECGKENGIISASTPLTLCEYLEFYKWKKQMFEQGRFWRK